MTTEAMEVIEFLCALEPFDKADERSASYSRISAEQGEAIAAFIHDRGGYSLFIELDERPGQFDHRYVTGEWHWKLRQARNGCREFFAILSDGAL